MYIFFWFFKQLYYILKRFIKHKFLLLLVFFVIAIFLFFKSDVFAYSNGNYTIIDPPSVVLSSMQNNSDLLDNNHNY